MILASTFRRALSLCLLGMTLCAGAATTTVDPDDDDHHDSLYAIEKRVIHIHVNADGSYEKKIEQTTLIKTQAAVDSLSQEDFDFSTTRESIDVLEAYTLLPNGEKIPVAEDAIRTLDEDRSDGAAMFSDTKTRVVIYPKVAVGARVTSKVLFKTHTPLFAGQFSSKTIFSPAIEYGQAEILLSHDPRIRILVDSKEVQGGRIEDRPDGSIQYRYQFTQPKIRPTEPAQVSVWDFAPFVHFSTFENHLAVGRMFEELAAPKSAVTPAVQALADQITQGITDPKQQARALYNWVTKEIRYVAIYLGNGGVVPHDADWVIHNRYGDCKDHNALFIALLAAKGIKASSALINSGEAHQLHKLGAVSPFNHVITYIPQWDLYLDSTAELAPFDILPASVLDKPVVLTALGIYGNTPKMTAEANQLKTTVHIAIDPEGRMSGSSETQYFGQLDYAARNTFYGYVGSSKRTMERNHLMAFRQTGTGRFYPTEVRNLNQAFTNKTTFELDPVFNFPGPGAMTVPVGMSPGRIMSMSYYKPRDKLLFPFECWSYGYDESYEIKLPDTVRITRIPSNVQYQDQGVLYRATYEQVGQVIHVHRVVQVQYPSMVCQPDDVQIRLRLLKVLQRDVRAQIFYE